MRVLLVNTNENVGGAAIACQRLKEALTKNGIEVRSLYAPRRRGFLCKAFERILMLPFVGFSWKRAWSIDVNWLGTDITTHEDFLWADIIHLHWVNQGMLSIEQIGKIARSGKRIVWTLHDLWPLESVYHYRESSHTYPYLEKCTLRRKTKAYSNSGINFVACSRWLMNQVMDSSLLKGNNICSIPNPIDSKVFHRKDKNECRQQLGLPLDSLIILFVSQQLTNRRKGAKYFIDAVNSLKENVRVVVLGAGGEEVAAQLSCPTHVMGYVADSSSIVNIYNAADVFVLPSLNDNLPNTIMEAMSCGVPCVGFNIGGIPEMIDHKKCGFIAEAKNTAQLAEGISYCLDRNHHTSLSDACISKVRDNYSQSAVATRFMDIYS